MKKSLLLLLLNITIITKINSQNIQRYLDPSNTGTFVEGLMNVNDTIWLMSPMAGTDSVTITLKNGSSNPIVPLQNAILVGGNWYAVFDLGNAQPNSYFEAAQFQTGNLLGTAPQYTLNVIAKPTWITQGGTALANAPVIVGSPINFVGTYPISVTQNQILPAGLTGIGGKTIDLSNCRVEFNSSYDYQAKTVSTSTASTILDLSTLGQSLFSKSIPAPGLTINPTDFGLAVVVADSIALAKYEVNFPGMNIPICPAIKIKIDAGISFLADLKGQVVLTQNGFDNVSGQTTKVIARLQANGFIRGKADVLFGAASATARLDVTGKIGIGMDFVSTPSPVTTSLWGGNLSVTGQVDLETFWGFGPNKTYGPTTFYTDSFGQLSAVAKQIANSHEDFFKTKSKTYNINGTLVVPSMHAMPTFGTRGNLLYTAWLERDPIDSSGYLLFNSLDTNGNCFTNNIVIAHNDFSMSNPKMAIMSSGKAVITWAQNRYNSGTYPPSYNSNSLAELLKSQDVYVAIYDTLSHTINTYLMPDDMSSDSSGRAEGEPKVTMGKGNQGLITWISKDPHNPESDVIFSTVTENSNVLTLTNPLTLYNIGINKEVNVSYSDSLNAVAVWINDPDGYDTTLNSNVMYSEWNGSIWTTPANLTSNSGNTTFEELSLDFNYKYCGVAWTSTIVKPTGDFEKRIDVQMWDDVHQVWDASKEFFDTDSMYYFQKPRITISDEGIASVTYQAINMFPDTNYIDPGQLNLYLNNLPTYASTWTGIDGSTIVSDTSTFVWSLDAGFGNNNILYTITQEYNSSGAVTNPNNGILFGAHSLSMVFRAIQVDHSLNISNVTEPNCNIPTGIVKNTELKYDFDLMQNTPNPVIDKTLIEFRTQKESKVTLTVRDIFGRGIAIKLLDKELASGIYQTVFETSNLESGVYLYTLTVNGLSMTKKMIIAK